MRRSILTEKVARRGHHLVREYRVDPFVLTPVGEVMTTSVETVPSTMTLHGAAMFLTSPATRHPSFPVVDTGNRVLGRAPSSKRKNGSEPRSSAFAPLRPANGAEQLIC